ncbi:hypothetical protein Corgl_1265 [Coriobacterium glomerans PW2]|uniref:Uncharacterized protein n=1 Tax=Coriobacterium glomerans (strain ATCC 49209 / DSM 20642 / JCM 10262 / PW2) TaxID=700015 RepID=F2N8I3_CORGP|nr:hypothetical protein Corgl_1265 [Coriobacterium glomerans PW2]
MRDCRYVPPRLRARSQSACRGLVAACILARNRLHCEPAHVDNCCEVGRPHRLRRSGAACVGRGGHVGPGHGEPRSAFRVGCRHGRGRAAVSARDPRRRCGRAPRRHGDPASSKSRAGAASSESQAGPASSESQAGPASSESRADPASFKSRGDPASFKSRARIPRVHRRKEQRRVT